VAPEWVERELTLHPAIVQAAVFGESRPFNVSVIVARPGCSRSDVEAAVRLANRMLPDYARISAWVPAKSPFTPSNLQLTANGRLKREAIQASYADALENLYLEETNVVF
jgi:long-subunit acyl-CoA synthetase (AMP-forming)